jgi:hypothetical protein
MKNSLFMSMATMTMTMTMTTVSRIVAAAPLNDLITELPGYGRPPTPQFSGYLDASAGCDVNINGPICKIHYWLALAANAIDDDDDDDDDDEGDFENIISASYTKPTGKGFIFY